MAIDCLCGSTPLIMAVLRSFAAFSTNLSSVLSLIYFSASERAPTKVSILLLSLERYYFMSSFWFSDFSGSSSCWKFLRSSSPLKADLVSLIVLPWVASFFLLFWASFCCMNLFLLSRDFLLIFSAVCGKSSHRFVRLSLQMHMKMMSGSSLIFLFSWA